MGMTLGSTVLRSLETLDIEACPGVGKRLFLSCEKPAILAVVGNPDSKVYVFSRTRTRLETRLEKD